MNQKLELKEGFFYSTVEKICPYFPNLLERKVITELSCENGVAMYNTLSKCGFRRSNKLCYAQICSECSNCISIRVDIANFALNRSFRRIILKNQDITYSIKEPIATLEQFELFQKYQKNDIVMVKWLKCLLKNTEKQLKTAH